MTPRALSTSTRGNTRVTSPRFSTGVDGPAVIGFMFSVGVSSDEM